MNDVTIKTFIEKNIGNNLTGWWSTAQLETELAFLNVRGIMTFVNL